MVIRTQQFELRLFPEIGAEEVRLDTFRDINAAKRSAGQLSRGISGPVDVAYAGDEPWDERYVTTASPSDFHAKGYRFERLD